MGITCPALTLGGMKRLRFGHDQNSGFVLPLARRLAQQFYWPAGSNRNKLYLFPAFCSLSSLSKACSRSAI